MTAADEQWVPKQHPLDREAGPEDPLELVAQPVAGDPEVMLACILEEYLWMGWNAEQLRNLFHHPGYPVLGQLRELFGDEELSRRIDALVGQTGVLRFTETLVEPDEDELEELAEHEMAIGGMFAGDLQADEFGQAAEFAGCESWGEPRLIQLGMPVAGERPLPSGAPTAPDAGLVDSAMPRTRVGGAETDRQGN